MIVQHLNRRWSLETNPEYVCDRAHESDRRSTSGRVLKSASPPLIGRQQELDLLARSLHEAVMGRPQMLLVQGDSGIGKTRLLKEARSLATLANAEVC